MNKFEISFFQKYIHEGQEIKGIIHIHFIDIFAQIFLWLSMGALIPSFMYFYSESIHNNIPFYFLEGLLIFVFIKIIYNIFDWYNDAWIITDEGITSVERSLFKNSSISIEFDKIEGIEVEQDGLLDKIFKKGTLIAHKFGEDSLVLENAINPYNSMDLIEDINDNAGQELPDDKYDVIMDALGGVVENYLDKKTSASEKQMELNKIIGAVEKQEGTIDLR